ncbi:MAG TPA: ABC transporter permease [Chloroflexi bacterium]|jgi:peptide/nickel transport system permease protein|nr:ABC transporter permease [Chloroflexota bacterium]
MVRYVIRRLGYMVVTMVFVIILGFVIIELPPGSYLEFEIERIRALGGELGVEQIRALEIKYGVNDPVYIKFWKWVSGFVRGDFGLSFEYYRPVSELIWNRLGFTMMISIFTLTFQWFVSIFVGVYSATHRYTIPDYIITVFQFIGLSMPAFLLALLLMVFAQQMLGWSVGGLFSDAYRDAPWSLGKAIDLLKHLWVPIVVIGANGTAWLTRVMRSNLLDVLNMQYVQTARAKGVRENIVIWKHAVRNAIHPLIMVLGMSLPAIISGETIVAIVLNLPTTGPLYFRALLQQDMYLAATFLMMLAFMLLMGNLLADIMLAVVDPRIRLGER